MTDESMALAQLLEKGSDRDLLREMIAPRTGATAIADAHEGLKVASGWALKASWQRCRVHFLRKAPAYATKGQRPMVLTFLDFPKEHRVKIHSTNVLERLNGEIKRRANVVWSQRERPPHVGRRAIDGAERRGAIQNRYMSLESSATISENRTIRLQAAPV